MISFRDKSTIRALLQKISELQRTSSSPVRIMEVCGTHTMTIHRYGLKRMLEESGVQMLSGPGCPVCITPDAYHEAAIGLVGNTPNLILATFGDMTRVPSSKGSLQTAIPAQGSTVKIVYSPEEALESARSSPGKNVVFFGVGFETTIPGIASAVRTAYQENLANFSLLSAFWIIPPPMRAILESGDTEIQGFLYPGHVSAIIGTKPYRFIADEYKIPGSIAGFEPVDILMAIISILNQIRAGKPRVENEYARVVRPEGNPVARAVMEEMLEPRDMVWRGLGAIPLSGLGLRKEYASFDAQSCFNLDLHPEEKDLTGCRCGEVLRGLILPPECSLFGKKCSPDSPQGPCMVSFEGACLAYYKYSR